MSFPVDILSTKKLSVVQKNLFEKEKINIIDFDFIEIKTSLFELKNINENLIFTSQNSVKAILSSPKCVELKTKKVFCVGLKTKTLLSENGFNVVAYTDYTADLAEIISQIYYQESYTFFCGNLRLETLPNILKEAKISLSQIQVYETTLTPQKINQKLDGILFFSPSGVKSFLNKNRIKTEICFCIGETTAMALGNTTKNIIFAEQTTVDSVINKCVTNYVDSLREKYN